MVEKGIKRELCNAIHQYAICNNKYMKDEDKIKESLYFKYWMEIIYMAGLCRTSFQ